LNIIAFVILSPEPTSPRPFNDISPSAESSKPAKKRKQAPPSEDEDGDDDHGVEDNDDELFQKLAGRAIREKRYTYADIGDI